MGEHAFFFASIVYRLCPTQEIVPQTPHQLEFVICKVGVCYHWFLWPPYLSFKLNIRDIFSFYLTFLSLTHTRTHVLT